jgi:hypothetical protein
MKSLACTAVIVTAATLGCGESKPYDVAEVSGQVLLDGQPLPNAHVLFRPVALEGQTEVGPEAFGRTDEQGRFSLTTVFDDEGATVGRNVVSISTLEVLENPADPENSRQATVASTEKVPPRYNKDTELVYEVSSSGVADATFQLLSR